MAVRIIRTNRILGMQNFKEKYLPEIEEGIFRNKGRTTLKYLIKNQIPVSQYNNLKLGDQLIIQKDGHKYTTSVSIEEQEKPFYAWFLKSFRAFDWSHFKDTLTNKKEYGENFVKGLAEMLYDYDESNVIDNWGGPAYLRIHHDDPRIPAMLDFAQIIMQSKKFGKEDLFDYIPKDLPREINIKPNGPIQSYDPESIHRPLLSKTT